jgi:hypothetical protein
MPQEASTGDNSVFFLRQLCVTLGRGGSLGAEFYGRSRFTSYEAWPAPGIDDAGPRCIEPSLGDGGLPAVVGLAVGGDGAVVARLSLPGPGLTLAGPSPNRWRICLGVQLGLKARDR